jgi:hypothetical protein
MEGGQGISLGIGDVLYRTLVSRELVGFLVNYGDCGI